MTPKGRSILPAFVTPGDDQRMVTIALVCVLVGGVGGSAVAASPIVGPVGDRGPTATDGGIWLSIVQADAANQTQFVGGGQEDRLGQAVVAAGDVNGDGVADLLVGAPHDDRRGSNAGAVYLFYGPVESNTRNASSADATFVGEAAGDHAGFAVAAGDVNGDGRSDVLVGAPYWDSTAPDAGAAYVIFGRSTTDSVSVVRLSGQGDSGLAGFDLGGGGDVVGDAGDDVLVSAPFHDADSNRGAAYLWPGACNTRGV